MMKLKKESKILTKTMFDIIKITQNESLLD